MLNLLALKRSVVLATAFFAFLPIAHAQGDTQTVSGTISVKIKLDAACEINGEQGVTENIDFGTLDFGSTTTLFINKDGEVLNGSGQPIQVLCSPGVAPKFKITGGSHDEESGQSANHAMNLGTDYVPYNLFSDSARSTSIQPNTEYALTGTADGINPQTLPLYGRAYGQTGLAAGTYTDTLQIEILF